MKEVERSLSDVLGSTYMAHVESGRKGTHTAIVGTPACGHHGFGSEIAVRELEEFQPSDWAPVSSVNLQFVGIEQERQSRALEEQLRAVFGYTQKLDDVCSRLERIESIAEAILQSVTATGSGIQARQTGTQLPSVSNRTRELQWRKNPHPEFVGHWVVVEGDQLIASGTDPASVVKEAREKGVLVPYLFRIEEPAQGVADIGV